MKRAEEVLKPRPPLWGQRAAWRMLNEEDRARYARSGLQLGIFRFLLEKAALKKFFSLNILNISAVLAFAQSTLVIARSVAHSVTGCMTCTVYRSASISAWPVLFKPFVCPVHTLIFQNVFVRKFFRNFFWTFICSSRWAPDLPQVIKPNLSLWTR